MINKKIDILISLTIHKDYESIKSILNNADTNDKGKLFELYLKELYEGNNWIVKYEGGKNDGGADLLLIHPDSPEQIVEIIQAKNHKLPLNYDNTRNELRKFEEISSIKYNSNHFKIISLNGFVKNAEEYSKINDLKNFNLYLADWSYIQELIDNYESDLLKRTNKPSIKLFAHNQIAYEQIQEEWNNNHNKVAVVQATGTGKTYIIAKILSDYINKRVLILAPSHYIIEEIKGKCLLFSNNVNYMTYAKLTMLSNDEMKSLNYDLIVLDEFHRTGAEVWGQSVLDLLTQNECCKVLGTSATPIRYSDGKDMVEELFNAKIKQEISVASAIIHKILPSPNYITALYTLEEELNNLRSKIEKATLSDEEKNDYYEKLKNVEKDWYKTSGVSEILKKYLNHTQNKFIVFCENEKHLKTMESLILKWFNETNLYKKVRIYSVYSGYGDSNNREELNLFKNDNKRDTAKVLLSIDMLNEGLHISDIDGVIFLRNTASYIIYYQQLGRALSVNGKTPIIFDFVNNFSNISTNNFINNLEQERNRYNQKRNIHSLNEQGINYHIIDESKNAIDIFQNIENQFVGWNIRYEQLKGYYIENGHSNVPNEYKENPSLGFWVSAQRQNFKKNKLSDEQINLLNKIHFKFDNHLEMWKEKYDLLVEFYNQNGHSNVPQKYEENSSLGIWVNTQRTKFKNNKLSEEQIQLLYQVNFQFFFDSFEIWKEKYDLLLDFFNKNGHSNIPQRYGENPSLGKWINSQRQNFKNSKLSNEKINLLNKVEFKFLFDNFEIWKNNYDLLVDFFNKNGHSNIPKQYKEIPFLGHWVSHQREAYKKNQLSNKQIYLLNQINFIFDNFSEKWKEKYNLLFDFYNKNGHSNIPYHFEENSSLASWVSIQRQNFKKNKLYDEQIKLLEQVDFQFSFDNVEVWKEKYNLLLEFYNRNGHSNVPQQYKVNPSLGNWVGKQRKKYKKSTLSDEQIRLLNQVEFKFSLK